MGASNFFGGLISGFAQGQAQKQEQNQQKYKGLMAIADSYAKVADDPQGNPEAKEHAHQQMMDFLGQASKVIGEKPNLGLITLVSHLIKGKQPAAQGTPSPMSGQWTDVPLQPNAKEEAAAAPAAAPAPDPNNAYNSSMTQLAGLGLPVEQEPAAPAPTGQEPIPGRPGPPMMASVPVPPTPAPVPSGRFYLPDTREPAQKAIRSLTDYVKQKHAELSAQGRDYTTADAVRDPVLRNHYAEAMSRIGEANASGHKMDIAPEWQAMFPEWQAQVEANFNEAQTADKMRRFNADPNLAGLSPEDKSRAAATMQYGIQLPDTRKVRTWASRPTQNAQGQWVQKGYNEYGDEVGERPFGATAADQKQLRDARAYTAGQPELTDDQALDAYEKFQGTQMETGAAQREANLSASRLRPVSIALQDARRRQMIEVGNQRDLMAKMALIVRYATEEAQAEARNSVDQGAYRAAFNEALRARGSSPEAYNEYLRKLGRPPAGGAANPNPAAVSPSAKSEGQNYINSIKP